jgi:hypothetical protein
MFRKIFGEPKEGKMSSGQLPPNLPRPYKEDHTNLIYNLLFCDEPELFRSAGAKSPIDVLFRNPPDNEAVQRLALDEKAESRARAVAFHWLLRHEVVVPTKILLGAIVEVPQPGGLDTLAAYADETVRYINQSRKMSVFEAAPSAVSKSVRAVMTASQNTVNQLGPWDKARLPAPSVQGKVRLSFVVSDGLYFWEGPFEAISPDAVGGPVLGAASQLLQAVVSA